MMLDFSDAVEIGGIRVSASVYCPTWKYYRTGWRKHVARLPIGRWLRSKIKKEQDRVVYMVDGVVICSYENFSWMQKNGIPDWIKR